MYREFEIGTAKPTAAERARAPHHLLDFVDPSGYITAGEYARQAREVLGQIKCAESFADCGRRNRLYLRALLEGLFAGPQRSEELRERLRERAEEKRHRLSASDPEPPGPCRRSEDSRPTTSPSWCGRSKSAWPRGRK